MNTDGIHIKIEYSQYNLRLKNSDFTEVIAKTLFFLVEIPTNTKLEKELI